MDLRKSIKDFQKGGTILYGTVESVANGRATVFLPGNSQRMTNLEIADELVVVGDTVLIDYSIGIPPIVKKIQSIQEEEEALLAEGLASSAEVLEYNSAIGFSIYGTEDIAIGSGGWSVLGFGGILWDDGFLSGGAMVVPTQGLYFLCANIALSGFDAGTWVETQSWSTAASTLYPIDATEYFILAIYGSSYGLVAIGQGYPIDFNQYSEATLSVSGMLLAEAGETVYAQVYVASNNPTVTLEAHPHYTYPRFSCQRLDLSSGEYGTVVALME